MVELVGITRGELEDVCKAAIHAGPRRDALMDAALAAQKALVDTLGLRASNEGCRHFESQCFTQGRFDELCSLLGVK